MSIRIRLIIILLIFTLVPTTLFELLSFQYARKTLQSESIAKLETTADLKVVRIESFFSERIGDITILKNLSIIKSSLPIIEAYKQDKLNSSFQSAKKKLDSDLEMFEHAYSHTDVMLLNIEGVTVYTSNNEHGQLELGKPLPDVEAIVFEEGKKGIYLSNIFRSSREDGKFGIFITAPIHDFGGQLIGVVALEVDMTPLYDLIQDTRGLGQTGETLIGKQIGNKAIFLNPLRYDPNATLKRVADFGKKEAIPIQEAVQGRDGSGISIDYRGEEVIAVWRYIPILNYGLVAKIDTKEAFESVGELRSIIIFLVILFAFISTLAAIMVAKSLTRPILKLKKGTEVIGKGNLDYKVGTQTQDEIGQLSRAIDRMAENLKSVTSSRDELNKEIEERNIVEEKLNQLAEKLAHSNEELEHFAYIASHDLQEPLRMVTGFLRLLQQRYKGKLDSDADEFIAIAVEGAERMKMMIKDLLIYCRVETQGKSFECTDCNKVLEQTINNLNVLIKDSGATISSEELPNVLADNTQLIILFQNLISNAIKYRSEEPPRIHISVKNHNQCWLFSINDNGIGINPKNKDKVFIIFNRLHDREKYQGTGIGLAVCRKIVERHNGRIWVESLPGKGSTFYFILPPCK